MGCMKEPEKDALHYLKEYKDKSHWLDIQISDHVRAFEQWGIEIARLKENPPLTWDELKAMEGKPVWVEAESLSVGVSPYWKDWYIIKSFSNDEFMYCNDGFEWAKEMQGRLWQAFKKERG